MASSGQTMNDRKLLMIKINDDFHKLSPDKGIFKIGSQTAEILADGLPEPPLPPHRGSDPLRKIMDKNLRITFYWPLGVQTNLLGL